jgi:hypothetical protein
MDNKFEQFITAYQNANQATKAIIDSETIGVMIDELLTSLPQYRLLKPKFLILTSNLLLGVITELDLEANLQTLEVDASSKKFLSTKIQTEVNNYKLGNVKIIPSRVEQGSGEKNPEVEINYEQTSPNPLVRPIPQSPYAEVPTYESSQTDIYPIRKRPGVDDPKWGAE